MVEDHSRNLVKMKVHVICRQYQEEIEDVFDILQLPGQICIKTGNERLYSMKLIDRKDLISMHVY